MTADLLTAKISRGFDHLDADGDGRLDENDHILMGQRAAKAVGHAPGSPGEQSMVDIYLRIWREAHVPNIPAGESAITKEHFITGMLGGVDADLPAVESALRGIAEAFLEIADIDADGTVSPQEFLTFQRGHFPGITDADVTAAFEHLDTDGNGTLSAEEFTRAIIEYWTTTDPNSPSNWWLGPPPEV